MTDVCIIGGGIIGLSIARELAGRGLSVRVLAREPARQTASWAAAGIFPPAPRYAGAPPGDVLTAWSDELHRQWARDLLEETGIDNGLRECGGLHVAADERQFARLCEAAATWTAQGTQCERLDAADIAAVEPALADAVARGRLVGGFVLPAEMQIRPPRHLQALERACLARGVVIEMGVTVRDLDVHGGNVRSVVAERAGALVPLSAGQYVLAAGAWSGSIAERLGLVLMTRPIRGQIALLRFPQQPLRRVINRGLSYLVPRDDGRLLVGSTLEDAGFATGTTTEAIDGLLGMVRNLLGTIDEATLEQSWAGLRPGSIDGLPTIGRIPGCDNALVAAGHFRAGLHQSTGTAVLVADLITARPSTMSPAPFAPDRVPGAMDVVGEYLARAAAEA
ncbi:MAG: FAD-dependent oxidoreductase [Pirellulales bacterium]